MGKTLTLSLGGSLFELTPKKVDRDKLYGRTELRVINADGSFCCQAAINSDGVNIVCPGATKIGVTDGSGRWVEKQSLMPMAPDGSVPPRIPSSFDVEIELTREASVEELLDMSVQSVYMLAGDEVSVLESLLNGRIYAFEFSYRGGYESNSAFLLASEHGLFLLTGTALGYDYVGLEETGLLDDTDEELNIEEGGLDFSMM